MFFVVSGVSRLPDREDVGPLFVCCLQLLIQYINRHWIPVGHLYRQPSGFFQNMFILYCWYWGSFVWLLLFCCMMSVLWWLENIWWCVSYDLAVMSTACIDSMIEHVAWNEASCVVSPVLLMCGSIISVKMTYKHFSRGLLSDLAWWMRNIATLLLGRFCTACS